METVQDIPVQVAVTDLSYRGALCKMLASMVSCHVSCVEEPDLVRDGVLVVDSEHLDRLPRPVPRPERVVLIAHDEPTRLSLALSRAWDAGVHSVIYDKDPLSTAVLAILAARLRSNKALPGDRKGRP